MSHCGSPTSIAAWQLVDRHADPLVEQIALDDLLKMMRN